MKARTDTTGSPVPAATGVATLLLGLGFVGTGLWARRDVRRALERERIAAVSETSGNGALVTTAAGARAMAEVIRRNTLASTGGRTYAETEPYLDGKGVPTADAALAAKDERTGEPVENPAHALWLQATTLQGALMQAYVAFRLAELTVALGASFAAAGLGLTAAGRGRAPQPPRAHRGR